MKRSPLRDVAGMLRSFHYAASSCLLSHKENGWTTLELLAYIKSLLEFWVGWVSAAFMREYMQVAVEGGFLPESSRGIQVLLDAYLMEKVLYEINYELNNRPGWVGIPLDGMMHLLGPYISED
jgi:maltose alpha-D-glucosyltransferase/alpha-amylase